LKIYPLEKSRNKIKAKISRRFLRNGHPARKPNASRTRIHASGAVKNDNILDKMKNTT
jgi:hypothetical protein